MQPKEQKEYFISKGRVESFSDAIIAIVITLMILEVRIPEVPADASSKETWLYLLSAFPVFISFLLSFIGLAILWVNHHQFFLQVQQFDIKMLWLNLHLLFWMCVIPVSTSFLGRSYQKPEATAFYGFNLFMTLFAFAIMREYVNRHPHLLIDNISPSLLKKMHLKNWIAVLLYFISIFTGYISTYISIIIFAIVHITYLVPQRVKLETKR